MFEYKFCKDSGCQEYDGDLEKDLIQIGVSKEHIEKMKNEIILPTPMYYPVNSSLCRETKLVPLNRVVAFSRGNAGKSVFENVRSIKKGEREPYKFADCWSHIDSLNGIVQMHNSFESGNWNEPIKMVHEITKDVYFVSVNGNHRTLMAKLLGAPYIKANVLEVTTDNPASEKY